MQMKTVMTRVLHMTSTLKMALSRKPDPKDKSTPQLSQIYYITLSTNTLKMLRIKHTILLFWTALHTNPPEQTTIKKILKMGNNLVRILHNYNLYHFVVLGQHCIQSHHNLLETWKFLNKSTILLCCTTLHSKPPSPTSPTTKYSV